jgi:flagellar motility protein MotE (MotC chaperone)
MIFADMKGEEKTLENLRIEIAAEMKLLLERMDDLERKAGEIDKKKTKISDHATEIKKTLFEIDSVEHKRIKQMAAVYDVMDATAAAELLQQMADSGKLDTAVKIISQMQERQAAKVLAQMQDRGTVVLMLEKLRVLKKSTPEPVK